MLSIERDFLNAIKNKNNLLVLLCLERGLTPNIKDEQGNTALEYALKYDNELFFKLAKHPKTTKETLGRALEYIEAEHFFNEDIFAFKKWEKEASFLKKLFDAIIGQEALKLSINAAQACRSLYIKQQFLLNLYQKER